MLFGSGLFSIADDGSYKSKSVSFEISYKSSSSTWINQSYTVSNTYKTTKRLSYRFENLEADTYDVKIKRTSAYDTNTRVANALDL